MVKTLTELKKSILDYLCRTPEIDVAMNEVLALVGTYFNVDRAYVFENSKDGRMCSNTYEWCNEGIQPEINHLQNVRYEEDLGGIWPNKFGEDDIYFCRDVKTLPDNIRAIIEPQNITSMLHCAVRVHGEFKGYIGFDNCSEQLKGWETDQDAIDTLIYTSHLLTLYLLDYRKKTDQQEEKDRKMQQKLRQADDMFADLLTNINCGVTIYAVSEQGTITVEYLNEGLGAMAGYSKQELLKIVQDDVFVTINSEYRAAVHAAFARIVHGEHTANVLYQATTKTGEHPWIMLKLSGSPKSDGVIHVYGTFFDVSAEIQSQQELKKRYELEKQHSMNDSNTVAYAVFNLSTGQTLEMERRAPLLPLDAHMDMDGFCDDIVRSILMEEHKTEFRRIFRSSELIRMYKLGIDKQAVEFQRVLPNRKLIWVKSTFHLMMEPGGTDILLFYNCSDINLRKTLEIMTSFMANEDYDMMGCINFRDDSAIMMYGNNSSYQQIFREKNLYREENYSKSLDWFVNQAVVPEEREQYRAKFFVPQIREQLSRNDRYEFQIHVLGQNGAVLTKKIRYFRYGATSQICLFTQTDITQTVEEEERKQQELKTALLDAEQANQAKTSFLSRISHDMRTPMNGILGLAALMQDKTDVEEIKADLAQLELSGQYLLQLINDTLDMNKIEAGRLELRREPVNSQQIFSNILVNANLMAQSKGVQLTLQAPPIATDQWIGILADSARLEQIIMNVISNAIKFTPPGGTVDLIMQSVSITEEQVTDQYIIRDSGIGMSEAFLPHLFDAFSQEGRANTDREAGTGLGMSIVKKLVDLMGGEIFVKSKLNEGTEITLLMHYPVYHGNLPHRERQKVDEACLCGKRILLCEDHPLNAQIASRLLNKKEVLVEHASDGVIGVEKFRTSAPGYYHAILMDIRMPNMDGLEAAAAIRALDRPDAKTIPIIAMTANAYDEDVQKSLAVGMNAHLAKPVVPEKLYATLSEYVNAQKRR